MLKKHSEEYTRKIDEVIVELNDYARDRNREEREARFKKHYNIGAMITMLRENYEIRTKDLMERMKKVIPIPKRHVGSSDITRMILLYRNITGAYGTLKKFLVKTEYRDITIRQAVLNEVTPTSKSLRRKPKKI